MDPKVTPEAKIIIQLDEVCGRLEDLENQIKKVHDINTLILAIEFLPRTFVKPHQIKAVPANKRDTVFFMEIPRDKVAIITRVANAWFGNTFLEWTVDKKQVEHEIIERCIAQIDSPLGVRIPAFDEIKWVAINQDTSSHVFEVLCNGIIIDEEVYKNAVERTVEG